MQNLKKFFLIIIFIFLLLFCAFLYKNSINKNAIVPLNTPKTFQITYLCGFFRINPCGVSNFKNFLSSGFRKENSKIMPPHDFIRKKPLLNLYNLGVFKGIIANKNNQDNSIVNLLFVLGRYNTDSFNILLESAAENKSKSSAYNIYIADLDGIASDENYYKHFETENVKINIIPEKDIKIIDKQADKITAFSYVRLMIMLPEILSNIDKILYINTNALILKDLKELYNTPIDNKYLAAALKYELDGYGNYHYISSRAAWIYTDYNPDVMLLNLKKMRKDKISDKFISAFEKGTFKKYSPVLRIYNAVMPVTRIKKLPVFYNFDYRIKSMNSFEKQLYSDKKYDIEDAPDVIKKAHIITNYDDEFYSSIKNRSLNN